MSLTVTPTATWLSAQAAPHQDGQDNCCSHATVASFVKSSCVLPAAFFAACLFGAGFLVVAAGLEGVFFAAAGFDAAAFFGAAAFLAGDFFVVCNNQQAQASGELSFTAAS